MVRVSRHLDSKLVLIDPPVAERGELFTLFGKTFFEHALVSSADTVASHLLQREAILSTGIGGGVAIPHAQIPGLGRLIMAVSVHPGGIAYPALDEQPVRLVFCLIGDASTAADHLAGLARLARIARRTESLEELVAVRTPEEFIAVFEKLEDA